VRKRTANLEKTYEKLKKTQKKIHEAQKKELIGILAGGIAKDFDQILTKVLDNIDIVKGSLIQGDKSYKLLTKSEHECSLAKDLTKQLLTYSKMGTPKKSIASIEELMKKSTLFLGISNNIKYEFSIPDNLNLVEIDVEQIRQVIKNLVSNSSQALSTGGLIKVSAENVIIGKDWQKHTVQLKNGNYIKISIEDNGIGIPSEHLQKIFQPYFTTKNKSIGMGLAVAYSILKQHFGDITVDSAPGVGTTFNIYLPALKHESEPQKDSIPIDSFEKGQKKILVYDNEEITNEFLNNKLSQLGYESIFAKDCAEATELYKKAQNSKNPFDAVIIDLPIPGSIGCRNTIQKLIEIDPQIKAIVSSFYFEDPIMTNYRSYGFKGFITKPYQVNDLVGALKNVSNEVNKST
jgi:CheY-like chemotaxis protein